MFGKIKQLVMDNEKDRTELYKQSVLVFEKLQYKGLLDKLDRISAENIPALTEVFGGLDEIEAYLYYEIVQERLMVIEKLHVHVEDNEKEKVLQKYLYSHLWLLDASWDRVTETPLMEQTVKKEFDKVYAELSLDEKRGRYDIKYKKTSGKHVIIELKRADRKMDDSELMRQGDKYRTALQKLLDKTNAGDEPIEVVCIVGEKLRQWTTPREQEMSRISLSAKGIRVVLYQELINDAYRNYQEYLDKNKEAGRIYNIVQSIEMELDDN